MRTDLPRSAMAALLVAAGVLAYGALDTVVRMASPKPSYASPPATEPAADPRKAQIKALDDQIRSIRAQYKSQIDPLEAQVKSLREKLEADLQPLEAQRKALIEQTVSPQIKALDDEEAAQLAALGEREKAEIQKIQQRYSEERKGIQQSFQQRRHELEGGKK